jgi:hypothetical protein
LADASGFTYSELHHAPTSTIVGYFRQLHRLHHAQLKRQAHELQDTFPIILAEKQYVADSDLLMTLQRVWVYKYPGMKVT